MQPCRRALPAGTARAGGIQHLPGAPWHRAGGDRSPLAVTPGLGVRAGWVTSHSLCVLWGCRGGGSRLKAIPSPCSIPWLPGCSKGIKPGNAGMAVTPLSRGEGARCEGWGILGSSFSGDDTWSRSRAGLGGAPGPRAAGARPGSFSVCTAETEL